MWHDVRLPGSIRVLEPMMLSRCLAVLVCAIGLFHPVVSLGADDPREPRRYALIVGVHEYRPQQNLPQLPYTENDVRDLSRVLTESGYRVTVLSQDVARAQGKNRYQPHADSIRDELQALLATPSIGERDSLLIVLAGHGVQFPSRTDSAAERFFFCPADADIRGLRHAEDVSERSRLVSVDELYAALQRSPAGVRMLIVDACRNDPSAQVQTRSTNSVTLPNLPPPPGGTVAFYSCSSRQRAFEDADLKHGVFLHYVIEGLKGNADVIQKDGAITATELREYVVTRVFDYVREKHGAQQLPDFKGEIRGAAVVVNRQEFALPVATAPIRLHYLPPGVVSLGMHRLAKGPAVPILYSMIGAGTYAPRVDEGIPEIPGTRLEYVVQGQANLATQRSSFTIFRVIDPLSADKLPWSQGNAQKHEHAGRSILERVRIVAKDTQSEYMCLVDPWTVVHSSSRELIQSLCESGVGEAQAMNEKLGAWLQADSAFWVAMQEALPGAGADRGSEAALGRLADGLQPLATVRSLTGKVLLSPENIYALEADCRNLAEAQQIQSTLETVPVLYGNMFSSMNLDQAPKPQDPYEILSIELLKFMSDFIKTGQVFRQGTVVRLEGRVPPIELKRIESLAVVADHHSRQQQLVDNFASIYEGLREHYRIYERYPPAVLVHPETKVPYSWRVEILPSIGEIDLYDRYDFSEPWDGPNNRKLLSSIPWVYRHPDDEESINACVFALTGKQTAFSGVPADHFSGGRPEADFVDGMSQTILFAEARREVPWTKPEDIAYESGERFPKLGGSNPEGFRAIFADGRVRFVAHRAGIRFTNPQDRGSAVEALIEISDGRNVRMDDVPLLTGRWHR